MSVQRINQRLTQGQTGDISDVSAGTAMSGGGSSGAVTLNVVVDTATLVIAGQVFNQMARLTAAQRRRLPKSDYAIPSKAPKSGSYPINDKAHARAALRLIGHASPDEQRAIRRKIAQRYPSISQTRSRQIWLIILCRQVLILKILMGSLLVNALKRR